MKRNKSQTVLKSMKEFGTIFLGMTVFMSMIIFILFISLLPIFSAAYYFAYYNNIGGMFIMIGGYAAYFVIARKLGYLNEEVNEFIKIWR